MSFYKINGEELAKADEVFAPDFTLNADSDKQVIVDGWQWFDTLAQALAALANAPVEGVPQSVTRRQGKTVMELSPHPTHGNLWNAALAAANAIPDTPTRIVTVNYLLESTSFDHPQVLLMAEQLLGMTLEQVDAMFITAATL